LGGVINPVALVRLGANCGRGVRPPPDLDWRVGLDLDLGRIHGDRISPPFAAETCA
jgi:hypothetical protein